LFEASITDPVIFPFPFGTGASFWPFVDEKKKRAAKTDKKYFILTSDIEKSPVLVLDNFWVPVIPSARYLNNVFSSALLTGKGASGYSLQIEIGPLAINTMQPSNKSTARTDFVSLKFF